MKIRADFVTNSSSSSFVTIIATEQNGIRKRLELDSDVAGYDVPIEMIAFSGIVTGEDLLLAVEECINSYDKDLEENSWLSKIPDIHALKSLDLRHRLDMDDGFTQRFHVTPIGTEEETPTKIECEKTFSLGKPSHKDLLRGVDFYGYENDLMKISGCNLKLRDMEIPGYVARGRVVEIGNKAFAGMAGLKSVTIPESVLIIGKEAFANCPDLESVSLPKGLLYIGDQAFAGCPKLKKPEITNTVQLGKNIFGSKGTAAKSCSDERMDPDELAKWEAVYKIEVKKTKINIMGKRNPQESMLYIPGRIAGKYVDFGFTRDKFCGDPYLERLTIGTGFSGWFSGFDECAKLQSILVEKDVSGSIIGFSDCAALGSVKIESGFSGSLHGFNNCPKLSALCFEDDFKGYIRGFENCPNLKEIQIPAGAIVSCSSFSGSAWWNSFNGPIVINGKLIGFRGEQKELIIPETVAEIPWGFSRWTKGLSRIVIPPTVKCIERYAFNAYLTGDVPPLEIVVPAGHLNIGMMNENFQGSHNITLCAPVGCKIQKYAEKHGIPFKPYLP